MDLIELRTLTKKMMANLGEKIGFDGETCTSIMKFSMTYSNSLIGDTEGEFVAPESNKKGVR